ncbi:ABC-F family ATP-binding cassette domain-containing protein [Chitinophaga sp.]|uniref:ABC-F family ATP-binding cassette domain-containing protein n=1 Tax=Chitinophaga sp. TaxID=1869181 RepID=UPI0031D9DA53
MFTLQQVTYLHPDKDLLFDHIDLTIPTHAKCALIGNNGAGKSTLLKLMAGLLTPASGTIHTGTRPYYIPQHFGQYNELTIAQALHIDHKINALHRILEGDVSESNMTLLDDDWTIEERSATALLHWGLQDFPLSQPIRTLSGGQKTKVFLAGIGIHEPDIILLDEPSNHLDSHGRELLYDLIEHTAATIVVVSHDRQLLQLPDQVFELSKKGISIYGGNYDFYLAQKQIENNALAQDLKSKEKALRKARETERETNERQQKLDARGRKKQEKEGLPTISLNTFRNNAEKSTARVKGAHEEKVGQLAQDLQDLRKELPDMDKMKLGFENANLHKGKLLINAQDINFSYQQLPHVINSSYLQTFLWSQPLSFQINSGERLAIKGLNGSGKTTLIKMILGQLTPGTGTLASQAGKTVYIDQDYSLIHNQLSVYDQAQLFNHSALQEHEIKIRLTRFLFTKEYWDKPCNTLSGGEKMRLLLCCLTIDQQPPDMIILDEPTNNLDIQNVDILTAAINAYDGTLIVISHDQYFLEAVRAVRAIELK